MDGLECGVERMRCGVFEGWRRRCAVAGLLLAGSLGLSGCQFFFQCAKASCTNTTTGTTAGSTGDYAYVANSTTGTGYIAGYELSTGVPIAISGSPFNLGFVPSAMVVQPGNALLFIASATTNVVYAYTIAANGSLTIANGGAAVANEEAASMDITADGKYLFVLSAVTLTGVPTVDEYSIASTGVLTSVGSSLSALSSQTPEAVKVAPSGNFVVAALGSAGDVIFPLSSEEFTSTSSSQAITLPASTGDYGVTIDKNNVIYFARTGQVAPYSATAAGVATLVTNTTANVTTGSGDHSIALSSTGAYLYTGNATGNTVSAFTNNGGTLGIVSGSPYNGPASVAAVSADNSGKYLIAAGYNSGGVEEYAIEAGGTLTPSSTTANTGASGITLLAVTH